MSSPPATPRTTGAPGTWFLAGAQGTWLLEPGTNGGEAVEAGPARRDAKFGTNQSVARLQKKMRGKHSRGNGRFRSHNTAQQAIRTSGRKNSKAGVGMTSRSARQAKCHAKSEGKPKLLTTRQSGGCRGRTGVGPRVGLGWTRAESAKGWKS